MALCFLQGGEEGDSIWKKQTKMKEGMSCHCFCFSSLFLFNIYISNEVNTLADLEIYMPSPFKKMLKESYVWYYCDKFLLMTFVKNV